MGGSQYGREILHGVLIDWIRSNGRKCKQDFEVLLQVTAWKVDLENRKVGRTGLGVARVESSPTVFRRSA